MKRCLYKELLKWKNNKNRKPLLLQGARQVGKTWLVNQFGKKEYEHFIVLNFEQTPGLLTIFENNLSPDTIIENISLYTGKNISPENTLIFFDEIQAAPQAITSLKYFNESAPEYHIIAAGSLLGVSVGKNHSFPVGKVNFLTMYPMNFVEFLQAMNENPLAEKLIKLSVVKPFPEVIHKKLLNYYKLYLFIGGMPEIVADYAEKKDVESVRKIQLEILQAYKRDFSKYATPQQAVKTSEVWQSIPFQLARENKKFKYGDVRKNARSAYYETTIEWLKGAGLVNIAYNVTVPKLPVSGYADYSKFKLYLHDTGLLGAMLNLSSRTIISPEDIYKEYNGAFVENYVAQELAAKGYKPLFYWTSKSDAEVDFVLQFGDKIYPLEVKSGTSLNTKSLKSYADKYHPEMVVRTSPRNFIGSGNFINVPLYAVGSIENFLNR